MTNIVATARLFVGDGSGPADCMILDLAAEIERLRDVHRDDIATIVKLLAEIERLKTEKP